MTEAVQRHIRLIRGLVLGTVVGAFIGAATALLHAIPPVGVW